MTITKRHYELLSAIREFIEKFDRSPRVKDLVKITGMAGASVRYYRDILVNQGLLKAKGRQLMLVPAKDVRKMNSQVRRLETRGRSIGEQTNKYKSAAGTAGAKKLMENARKMGAFISGVSRLPAADDKAVLARIEMLGQREDAVKMGKAPMRDVVTMDRIKVRVSGARRLG